MPKKPIAVRHKDNGVITGVLLEGNKTVTPLATAVAMAKAGKIQDVHVVSPSNGKEFIRSDPDKGKANNLDNLPEV